MTIETTVVGSYPKPPEEGRPFTVRKTLHAIEKGHATPEDLAKAQDDLVTEVIREQEAAGIDLVTDGHARWDDILTPFARRFRGFEIGGLLRWFDNNVYYRKPICTAPLEWGGPATVEAFTFAQSVATNPVKAVIPGPVTFARLSIDEHYADHQSFVLAIARVLAQEAFELEAAGATVIQIDEPALLDAPEDLQLAQDAIYLITSELKSAESILATYFGDAKRLGPELFDIRVDGFGFDLISGPENIQLIRELPAEKKLQAGIVDARNTKLEDVEALSRQIEELCSTVGDDRLRVSPSAGLEFLPRDKARAKVERLAAAAQKVGA
ncbi:MAG TPA: methylcobamide--CoM methyltransferase [Actinomycetota bacterium]|nr:methylcobamide--CoM methyltransferase [Actinomycetota bacterium]